jgi:hypothetical protein
MSKKSEFLAGAASLRIKKQSVDPTTLICRFDCKEHGKVAVDFSLSELETMTEQDFRERVYHRLDHVPQSFQEQTETYLDQIIGVLRKSGYALLPRPKVERSTSLEVPPILAPDGSSYH